jgi:hypothetical protein
MRMLLSMIVIAVLAMHMIMGLYPDLSPSLISSSKLRFYSLWS